MGRRPLAGRDMKINQGHRRDEFFARMRRRGGVPRLSTQAPGLADAAAEEQVAEASSAAQPNGEAEPSEAEQT